MPHACRQAIDAKPMLRNLTSAVLAKVALGYNAFGSEFLGMSVCMSLVLRCSVLQRWHECDLENIDFEFLYHHPSDQLDSMSYEIDKRVSVPKFLWPLVFRNNSDILRRVQSIRSVSCQPTLCMT